MGSLSTIPRANNQGFSASSTGPDRTHEYGHCVCSGSFGRTHLHHSYCESMFYVVHLQALFQMHASLTAKDDAMLVVALSLTSLRLNTPWPNFWAHFTLSSVEPCRDVAPKVASTYGDAHHSPIAPSPTRMSKRVHLCRSRLPACILSSLTSYIASITKQTTACNKAANRKR